MSVVEREVVEAPVTDPVTTRDVLVRAADLLTEFGWCQYANARTANGLSTWYENSEAVSFCLYGAAHRAAADLGLPAMAANPILAEALGGSPVELVSWNNAPERTSQEVVARLREAAEKAA